MFYLLTQDNCQYLADNAGLDTDGDGIGDNCDNCPLIPNVYQEDVDNDSYGNVCDQDIDGDCKRKFEYQVFVELLIMRLSQPRFVFRPPAKDLRQIVLFTTKTNSFWPVTIAQKSSSYIIGRVLSSPL